MTVIVLCSLKGSPGVTTICAELATAAVGSDGRPPLLIDGDLAGGDLALHLGCRSTPGVATLATAARRDGGAPEVWKHTQHLAGGAAVLAGVSGPGAGLAIADFLPELAHTLANLGRVVLADLGRITPQGSPTEPILECASTVVVLARADVASALHLRAGMPALCDRTADTGIVLVGGRGSDAREFSAIAGAPVLGVLNDRARTFVGRHRPSRERRPLSFLLSSLDLVPVQAGARPTRAVRSRNIALAPERRSPISGGAS